MFDSGDGVKLACTLSACRDSTDTATGATTFSSEITSTFHPLYSVRWVYLSPGDSSPENPLKCGSPGTNHRCGVLVQNERRHQPDGDDTAQHIEKLVAIHLYIS